MASDFLLLYPPVTKPSEPPAGPLQIISALHQHNIAASFIDANVHGLHHLFNSPLTPDSTRVQLAWQRKNDHLEALQHPTTFQNIEIYKRHVLALNRLLMAHAAPFDAAISFSDFKQKDFKPVRSRDLIRAAEQPQRNPFYNYYESELLPHIKTAAPRSIGISLIYLNQALCAFALIGMIRREFPDVEIILGGGLVTSWMQQPGWQSPFRDWVDVMLAGKGEPALLEHFGIQQPDGVHYAPDFRQVDFSAYISPGKILPVTTSYGCYWRKCNFCPECAEGNAYDPVPRQQVIHNLHSAISEQRPSLVHFLDNALDGPMLRQIIEAPLNTPWYGYVRFEPFLTDLEFCRELKNSGCVMLQLGLESGDTEVLNAMHKGIDLERVKVILRNLQSVGIATYVYVLFGTPSEDEKAARRTVDFVAEFADAISYLNPAIFNLPLYSNESASLKTTYFYEGDLTLYTDFEHPLGWDRKHVRHFLRQTFQPHPNIKPVLKANPPFFTSNHAPFFHMEF